MRKPRIAVRISCFGQGRVIYTARSGRGETLRTKTSYPKALGGNHFQKAQKIPLAEKRGKNWQRDGSKKKGGDTYKSARTYVGNKSCENCIS